MRVWHWITPVLVTITIACGDGTGTQLAGNVAVSVATQSPRSSNPAAALSRARAFDDTITSDGDTIIVTRAQLVLREVEFARDETACAVENDPSCEDVEFGPVLVELPLVPGAVRQFAAELPVGTYVEVEFDVHKPDDDDPQDLDFLQRHPEFVDVSIRVEGTFNGVAFVFISDLNVKQELDLVPPLILEESMATNVTIFVAIDSWFRRVDGTLVDPATANKGGTNENLVRDNIIASFRAFEDQDEDGDDRDG